MIIEPNNGRSRGFGFVVFANPEVAEHVVKIQEHKINEKLVDVKRAISKDVSLLLLITLVESSKGHF